MKWVKIFLTGHYFVFFLGWNCVQFNELQAQSACTNMGFELGTFEGWEYRSGCNPETANHSPDVPARETPCYEDVSIKGICCTLNGKKTNRLNPSVKDSLVKHSLHNSGVDTFGNFSVVPPIVPKFINSKYSLRLGNAVEHGEADRVERYLLVDSSNAIIAYEYAFLLNDPGNHHKLNELPYFEVNVFNSVTEATIPCGYAKYISNGNFDSVDIGLDPYDSTLTMTVRYQEWKTVYLDLTDYIGQHITLQFTNSDCAKGGHWGYTYLASGCKPFIWKDTTICHNQSATLTSPFPKEGFNLLWSTGETSESITVTPETTTTYTLTIVNKSKQPGSDTCTNQFEITVNVLPTENISLKDTSVCQGESVTIHPKPEGINYEWFQNKNDLTPFYKGKYFTTEPLFENLSLYVQNPFHCNNQGKVPVLIEVIDYEINAGANDTICSGDSIRLKGSGTNAFYWTPSGSLSDSASLNPWAFPKQTTTYTLQTYDTTFCQVKDEVTIYIENLQSIINATNACVGNKIQFQSKTEGYLKSVGFQWNFGDGTESTTQNPIHLFDTAGVYQVHFQASTRFCRNKDTLLVEVYPRPTADFTASAWVTDVDHPEITFTDLSSGATEGVWDLGDFTTVSYHPNQIISHLYYATNDAIGPFVYKVGLKVRNEFNCWNKIIKKVLIKNYWTFYAPNSFTPNGDGYNDVFKVFGIGILDFQMRIYDRWGELLFISDNINSGWDGKTIKNSPNVKKQDVYVWEVSLLNNRGIREIYKGHVSLLK